MSPVFLLASTLIAIASSVATTYLAIFLTFKILKREGPPGFWLESRVEYPCRKASQDRSPHGSASPVVATAPFGSHGGYYSGSYGQGRRFWLPIMAAWVLGVMGILGIPRLSSAEVNGYLSIWGFEVNVKWLRQATTHAFVEKVAHQGE